MKKDIYNLYKDLKGTGSELRDNRDYDRLTEMVGGEGAKRAIRHMNG